MNDHDPGGGSGNGIPPFDVEALLSPGKKSYDYLLKVLLVGDSDVGKQEILDGLESTPTSNAASSSASDYASCKQTIILIDGKRVKLQLWDTSGQGRFCTIIRSYSRGAQGILLVYDITSKWSFEGIGRWLKEVDQHAPGVPKVLVGNRLHLAFKRQVAQADAESYAERQGMGFFEVSPLVNFNVSESLVALARMALRRNGMERLWRNNKVTSLYELCALSVVANVDSVYAIDKLPLPDSVRKNLKSYALTKNGGGNVIGDKDKDKGRSKYRSLKFTKRHAVSMQTPADNARAGKSCVLS